MVGHLDVGFDVGGLLVGVGLTEVGLFVCLTEVGFDVVIPCLLVAMCCWHSHGWQQERATN